MCMNAYASLQPLLSVSCWNRPTEKQTDGQTIRPAERETDSDRLTCCDSCR